MRPARSTTQASRLHVVKLPIACLRMRDLAAADGRDWMRDLESRGGSPSAVRNARAALSVMLGCAVEDGDLGSNPAARVRYVPSEQAMRAHSKRKRRALTAADVPTILEAVDEEWHASLTSVLSRLRLPRRACSATMMCASGSSGRCPVSARAPRRSARPSAPAASRRRRAPERGEGSWPGTYHKAGKIRYKQPERPITSVFLGGRHHQRGELCASSGARQCHRSSALASGRRPWCPRSPARAPCLQRRIIE